MQPMVWEITGRCLRWIHPGGSLDVIDGWAKQVWGQLATPCVGLAARRFWSVNRFEFPAKSISIYCQGPQTRSRTAALNKAPFLIPTTGVRWSAVPHPQPQIKWSMDQCCTYSNSSSCRSHWMHQVIDCSTFHRFKSPITGSPALHFSSDLSSTDSKTYYYSRPHSIHHERGIQTTQSGTYIISSSELSHSTRHQTYGYVIKPNLSKFPVLDDLIGRIVTRGVIVFLLSHLPPGPLRNQSWFSDISASSWSSVPAVTGTKQPWFRGSGHFWYSTMGPLKGLPPRRDRRKRRTLIRFHNLTAETRACAVVRVEYMMITVRKWNPM